uniref:Uncharacterized protein n=1 Tax=Timema genevievae TaxID=629358 RepID=A0A7R9JW87_TIMGE|nr:unnamed protein product [Timema genevievae]
MCLLYSAGKQFKGIVPGLPMLLITVTCDSLLSSGGGIGAGRGSDDTAFHNKTIHKAVSANVPGTYKQDSNHTVYLGVIKHYLQLKHVKTIPHIHSLKEGIDECHNRGNRFKERVIQPDSLCEPSGIDWDKGGHERPRRDLAVTLEQEGAKPRRKTLSLAPKKRRQLDSESRGGSWTVRVEETVGQLEKRDSWTVRVEETIGQLEKRDSWTVIEEETVGQ